MARTALAVWSTALALVLPACSDDGGPRVRAAKVLWESRHDDGGYSVANDVAVCADHALALGRLATDGGDALVLRAYDARSGELLWEGVDPIAGATNVRFVACDNERAYAEGIGSAGDWPSVRAYSASNGTLLWERAFDFRDAGNLLSLEAAGGVVYVLAAAWLDDAGNETIVTTRALDGASGNVIWEHVEEMPTVPWVAGRLYVLPARVCRTQEPAEGREILCLDRETGEALWETAEIGSEPTRHGTLEANGELLAAAGSQYSDGIVGVYDSGDGHFVWSRRHRASAYIADTHVAGTRVFVTGAEFFFFDPEDPYEETDSFFAEALSAADGSLIWRDEHLDEQVRHSVLSGDRLIVTGADWQSRVYDARHGSQLSQGGPQANSRWMWNVASDGDAYFMVGAIFRDNSRAELDFTIRAVALD